MRIRLNGHSYALFSERGQVGIDNSPAVQDFRDEQRKAIQRALDEQRRLMEYLLRKQEGGARSTFVENQNWLAQVNPNSPMPVRYAIPYWPLFLAFLVLPMMSLLRYRRSLIRIQQGRCWSCGYNLSGNESGTCPECGAGSALNTGSRNAEAPDSTTAATGE